MLDQPAGTTRMRRRKASQPVAPDPSRANDPYIQMIQGAEDPTALRAALYAARGTEGIDMAALRKAAQQRRQSFRQ